MYGKELVKKRYSDPWRAVRKAAANAAQSVRKDIQALNLKFSDRAISTDNILKSCVPSPILQMTIRSNEYNGTSVVRRTSSSAKQFAAQQIPQLAENTVKNDPVKPIKNILPTFSLCDQLPAIAIHFNKEIIHFLKYLEKSYSSTKTESFPIVATIRLTYNKSIDSKTFDIIQDTVIGWIGNYQYHEMDTPIFHNMITRVSNIAIICENPYAYDCLQMSIVEIDKLLLLPHLVSVVKILPNFRTLDCYSVIYEDILNDPEQFLHQIKLQKPILEADLWIIVSHEVYQDKQETHFVLLIDEQSSLALTYYFDSKLYICMSNVKFEIIGSVSACEEK